MTLTAVILGLLIGLVASNGGDEILGCAGFAKISRSLREHYSKKGKSTSSKIDYSAVTVLLKTKDGVALSESFCSPNGYYFIPADDNGDFQEGLSLELSVRGPKGWTVEPKSVSVRYSRQGLKGCEKDVDFSFTGFEVHGSVVAMDNDENSQPQAGVTVELIGQDNKVAQSAVSGKDGIYSFQNVHPALWTVRASHETWTLANAEAALELVWDNTEVQEPFRVVGYQINGAVRASDAPILGVRVSLHPISEEQYQKQKAGTDVDATGEALQTVVSDSNGRFVFSSVPFGHYALVPSYGDAGTAYNFMPRQMATAVTSRSNVDLKTKFVVGGFSLSGKVVTQDGRPIPRAQVSVSGPIRTVVTTAADGSYTLESLKAGVYSMKTSKQYLSFDTDKVDLQPMLSSIPDIVVDAVDVCGRILPAKQAGSKVHTQQRVAIYREDDGTQIATAKSDSKGQYCFSVKSGQYHVVIKVEPSKGRERTLFFPKKQVVQLSNQPVLGLDFSPASVKIAGQVHTIGPCLSQGLDISLEREGQRRRRWFSMQEAEGVGHQDGDPSKCSFEFGDVSPGMWRIKVVKRSEPTFCWGESVAQIDKPVPPALEADTVSVEVSDDDVTDILFKQSGYLMTVNTKQPLAVTMQMDESSEFPFELVKGENKLCMARLGVYEFEPAQPACVLLSEDASSVSTGSAGAISVAGYYFGIPIEARYPEDKLPADNRLEITVTCKTRGSDNFAEQKAEWQGVSPTDENVAIYRAICFGQLGDEVEITPVIKRETDPVGFLLSPRAQVMKISLSTVEPPSGCHLPSPPITATQGLFITGRVTPAIPGVVIHASEPSGFTQTVTTDASGAYALGPLYKGPDYTVDASLDGYFVTRSATDKYSFHVLRLASLDVKVTEASNGVLEEPVGGVLLTVSGEVDDVYDGEDTFRSNVKTYANGTRQFSGLFPGTYFIRPVLKEYEFQPVWQSVKVVEGKPHPVHFRSVRVSFSCYGTVTTLNGVPQAGVRVLARQKDNADAVVEETRTDQEGNFRVRGLLPESEYEFFLHGLTPVPSRASFPRSQVVRTKGHSDIRDIKFVSVVAPKKAFEIIGTVDVASEWVDSVTVTLSSATSPGHVISRVKVSALRYFEFPKLKKGGYILRVTTTISRKLFTVESNTVTLRVADTKPRAVAAMKVEVIPNKTRAEINNSGFFTLVAAAAAVLVIVYRNK